MNSAAQPATAPVSVVIPCFRCADTLRRAIASVHGQTLRPAEVILVDDASGDDTLDSLWQIAADHGEDWIRIVALPANLGAASARNRGWERAGQPLVAFLDADDSWHPRKIEIQYRHMAAHADLALCAHTSARYPSGADNPEPALPPDVAARPVTRRDLLIANRFITPSVMLRRDLPFRFQEGRRHMEDHLLWLRMACHGLKMETLSAALAYTHKAAYGEGGLSSNMLAMARADLDNYRQLRREGLLGPLEATALYFFSVLKSLRRLVLAAVRNSARHP